MAQRDRRRSLLFHRNNGLQLPRISLFYDHHNTEHHSSRVLWLDLQSHSKTGEHVRGKERIVEVFFFDSRERKCHKALKASLLWSNSSVRSHNSRVNESQ